MIQKVSGFDRLASKFDSSVPGRRFRVRHRRSTRSPGLAWLFSNDLGLILTYVQYILYRGTQKFIEQMENFLNPTVKHA